MKAPAGPVQRRVPVVVAVVDVQPAAVVHSSNEKRLGKKGRVIFGLHCELRKAGVTATAALPSAAAK